MKSMPVEVPETVKDYPTQKLLAAVPWGHTKGYDDQITILKVNKPRGEGKMGFQDEHVKTASINNNTHTDFSIQHFDSLKDTTLITKNLNPPFETY
mmetsp:Transcript_19186/g.23764  ORF Transcript_19186/g.23764 Transcript_19186/m.23764 type:complete len:96 (+) Transcript_19186:442-729(+)